MPLYTYVLSYGQQTKVRQLRKSNYRGWISQVVAEAFPELAHGDASARLMRASPEAVLELERAWSVVVPLEGGPLTIHIVETRA